MFLDLGMKLGGNNSGWPITFGSRSWVEPALIGVVSRKIKIKGAGGAVSVLSGTGHFRINGGAWVTIGTVKDGDIVEARVDASLLFETQTSLTLSVCGTFYVMTRPAITEVSSFSLMPEFDAELSALVTSNSVTVVGPETAVPISVVGGMYSINGGLFLATEGAVIAGDSVRVQMESASLYETGKEAVLTIGNKYDNFIVTTIVDPLSPLNMVSGLIMTSDMRMI